MDIRAREVCGFEHIEGCLGGAPACVGTLVAYQTFERCLLTSRRVMADLFVMCPDCGLSARLRGSDVKVVGQKGKCAHRKNPLACPVLMPLISTILAVWSPAPPPARTDEKPPSRG